MVVGCYQGTQGDRRLDPRLGVNLSMFWPGLGQFYTRRWEVGWGLLVTEGLLLAIAFVSRIQLFKLAEFT